MASLGLRKAVRVGRPWRLEVDALVFADTKLVLAEAKVYNLRDGVGDLLCYRPQIPVTPELQEYKDWPVEMVLVIPWTSDWALEIAETAGVNVDVFCPDWLVDYIEEHHKYWTKAYRQARAEKKAMRKVLGLE